MTKDLKKDFVLWNKRKKVELDATAEVIKYWLPAVGNLLDKPSNHVLVSDCHELDQLLGVDFYRKFKTAHDLKEAPVMNAKLKRLLTALAGPHGKTLLKAYRIKKGLEHDQ